MSDETSPAKSIENFPQAMDVPTDYCNWILGFRAEDGLKLVFGEKFGENDHQCLGRSAVVLSNQTARILHAMLTGFLNADKA